MAVLDLKNATIKIKDGYTGPSVTPFLVNNNPSPEGPFQVNNGGGYAAGAVTMTIDTGTGAIQTGRRFTVAGETGTPEHTVTAHVETLGNTTSITFTPALVSSVADDAVITLLDGYGVGDTVMVVDGGTGALNDGDFFTVAGDTTLHMITDHTETLGNTTSITFTPALGASVADNAAITIQPHELEINVGSGTLSFTETVTREYILNRGELHTVRDGDQTPMDVSFDFLWEFLKSASTDLVPTPMDALKKEGPASIWVSTSTDACEPYAVDIEVYHAVVCEDTEPERITFEDFRYETIEGDAKEATLSCAGKCNRTGATRVRVPLS